jgi:hypothetical protein
LTLYLDTEFNGHNGEIISLAIVCAEGDDEFYGELSLPHYIEPWVAENVVPHLDGVTDTLDQFRGRLRNFLEQHAGDVIIADWPGDFSRLMQLMCGPDYERHWIVPLTMQLAVSGELKPEKPHHALSDARALMEWDQARHTVSASQFVDM